VESAVGMVGSLHAMLNLQHLGYYFGGTTFTLLRVAFRVGGWVAILINPRNAKLGLETPLIYLFIFLGRWNVYNV